MSIATEGGMDCSESAQPGLTIGDAELGAVPEVRRDMAPDAIPAVGADCALAETSSTSGPPSPEIRATVAPDANPRKLRASIAALGPLVDPAKDVLVLHTRYAMELFAHGQGETRGRGSWIPDGQRFALSVRAIWALTSRDNPYADWLLIQIDERLHETRNRLRAASAEAMQRIEVLKRQGLHYSMLQSEKPYRIEIQPDSPYSYATASLIADFDTYARMIRTLARTDHRTDMEGHQAIRVLVRTLRTLFATPLPWARKLRHESLDRLTRNDFLAGARDDAKARVREAGQQFGPLPPMIFTGVKQPRHTLRSPLMSPARRQVLDEACRGWADGSATGSSVSA